MLQNLHNSYSDSSSTTSSSSQEEDYINMEVDGHHHHSFDSSIFNQSSSNEFEFHQSFSSSSDRDPHATTSPADELFYMGKLLPLHLPPRLEMVHKILHSTNPFHAPKGALGGYEDEPFSTPLFTPTAATPFESCNISPSESCEVSRELTPDDYKHILVEYSSINGGPGPGPGPTTCAAILDEKKSWARKMKMIKQSSSSSSSRIKWTSYIKSLFTKSSGCTSQHSAAAVSKARNDNQSKYAKKLAPFGQIKYDKNDNLVEDQRGRHRRSFSGAIKQLSKPKSSTTASSTPTSTSSLNLLALKRSISSSSEVESPIQAAIAHCKRSQKSRQIAEEERVAVCRG
ncbi:probable membrane-associated kinase regulator 4 [Salvia miltiorrhiza]|uniref:probable membrane-associated kinase regulator 4 n=1 Tax=Salvia miltiorrhiza TaxID=226208 RepID=UPI0025ACFF3D|nr:probable membrane-associated kinase regulator 4 [Salvia miltiorrhiza]